MPTVSLNPNANPPVSIDPQLHEASASNSVVTWVAAAGQSFTFTNVFGLPLGVFTNTQVSGSQITVHDNGQSGYFPYVIVVTSNGVQYSSRPTGPTAQSTGPTIHNK